MQPGRVVQPVHRVLDSRDQLALVVVDPKDAIFGVDIAAAFVELAKADVLVVSLRLKYTPMSERCSPVLPSNKTVLDPSIVTSEPSPNLMVLRITMSCG